MTSAERIPCSNPACTAGPGAGRYVGTPDDYGRRKDGLPNKRCPTCRADLARRGADSAVERLQRVAGDLAYDRKALMIVERFSGFPYARWLSDEAKAWEDRHDSLQRLWTEVMRRMHRRREWLAARRARRAAA